MKPKFNNLQGRRFSSLLVIAYAGTDPVRQTRRWRVRCELCGTEKVMAAAVLLAGRCRSCGCARRKKHSLRMKAALALLSAVEKCNRLAVDGEMLTGQFETTRPAS